MSSGNGEAKILEKAFQELAGGCEFTKEERELLEKLDDVLKNADIMVNKDGTSATVVTSDNAEVVGAYPNKETGKKDRNREGPFEVLKTDDKANSHSKILEAAYFSLAEDRDGLTDKERGIIEELDKLLQKADIVIGENVDAIIVQDDGRVYGQGQPNNVKNGISR